VKRSLTILTLILILASSLIPVLPANADIPGQSVEGSIVFTDISDFRIDLNLSVDYMVIDGRNMSSDDMRILINSGGSGVRDALNGRAQALFEEITGPFGANGSLDTEIKPGDSGPILLVLKGSASITNSNCSADIYRLMAQSGAVFLFSLKDMGIQASIYISPPDGYSINDAQEFRWNGKPAEISISSNSPVREGSIDVFVDIYRIDTTGSNQNLHMNISLESEAYAVPYSGQFINRSISLDHVSIPLALKLISCGYLEWEDWNSSIDMVMQDAREMMIAEFPNIIFSNENRTQYEDRIVMDLNATASIPVSQLLRAGALFRKVVSQTMTLRLYGTPGFQTTYRVIIPAGMMVSEVSISPSCPYRIISEGGRDGFEASIDDGRAHTGKISIDVLISLDPLIPLIMAVVLFTGMWVVVLYSIPPRRRYR
jgi:hypothetical protein